MPNTRAMTQRVELAAVMDRLAVDGLITDYAVAVDDGDWTAYRQLFTADGRADYRSAGGIEGEAGNVASWLADTMRLFAMRQHLIVNRRVRFGVLDQDTGDTAQVQADYVNPMRLADERDGAPPSARLRLRRPVLLRPAADAGRLAGARGGRTGEVAAAARLTASTRLTASSAGGVFG